MKYSVSSSYNLHIIYILDLVHSFIDDGTAYDYYTYYIFFFFCVCTHKLFFFLRLLRALSQISFLFLVSRYFIFAKKWFIAFVSAYIIVLLVDLTLFCHYLLLKKCCLLYLIKVFLVFSKRLKAERKLLT